MPKRTATLGASIPQTRGRRSLRVRQFQILPRGRCPGFSASPFSRPDFFQPSGRISAWCRSNMPGLEPGDRRCKSCRADQFQMLPWPNTSGIRLLSGTMQVGLLPAAPLPGGVKVARRFVKPHGVGASPTLAANLWKAGRYKLAAPVSKTGSVTTEPGALPGPSASIHPQPKESRYDYC